MRFPRGAGLVAALLAALVTALLASCAQPVREPAPVPGVPPDFPEAYYREAMSRGRPVYRIDPAASLVAIEVRRSGSLAHLGHDHVVASHDVAGYVAPGEGTAHLYVPLARLVVDEPALRAQAGLDTQPTEADIAGTRANMLEKVLETERYPYASIRVSGADPRRPESTIAVALTLHGATRTLQVPVRIESGPDRLTVTGRLSFDQTDFGMRPFSILGGAVAVRNRVDLAFRIHSVRAR